jgi:predicted outer membrane repeat protein
MVLTSNLAYSGGALAITNCQNNYINIHNLSFFNNSAIFKGGALFLSENL